MSHIPRNHKLSLQVTFRTSHRVNLIYSKKEKNIYTYKWAKKNILIISDWSYCVDITLLIGEFLWIKLGETVLSFQHCIARDARGIDDFLDVFFECQSLAMTDDSWKELMRWVRIETRVFFSLIFFFFFLHPRRSHNFPPCIFIEKNMRMTVECNFQVSFKCRSSKLTWEAIVGEESCWRSERQSVPRHVRHFEDQCQDRGKKTDAWASLQPYQPFWNEKKATTMRDTHVANVSFSSFFVPFLCHRLPNRGCVATDDVV